MNNTAEKWLLDFPR